MGPDLVCYGTEKWVYCHIASINQHSAARSTVCDRERERDRSWFLLFLGQSWISTVASIQHIPTPVFLLNG